MEFLHMKWKYYVESEGRRENPLNIKSFKYGKSYSDDGWIAKKKWA